MIICPPYANIFVNDFEGALLVFWETVSLRRFQRTYIHIPTHAHTRAQTTDSQYSMFWQVCESPLSPLALSRSLSLARSPSRNFTMNARLMAIPMRKEAPYIHTQTWGLSSLLSRVHTCVNKQRFDSYLVWLLRLGNECAWNFFYVT